MAQLAPWLAEPIDAGASFLKGAQAGSLIASTWARKEQLGLESARMGAALQEHALKMRAEEAELDYSLQQKSAGVELAQAYSRIAELDGGWTNPEVPRTLAAVGVKYPAIVGSAIWQQGQENIFKARTLDMQFKQLESMDKLRQSQIYENNMQGDAAAEDVTPEIRQVTDPTTGKPVSLIRTGPNSWREARGGGNIDPAEAARLQIAIENLVARRRAGQLDEKKFQLSILEKIQEIETAPLLGIKPVDQPAERAKRKAELLRQMRVMGITTEFVEPEGLRQSIEGQLGPVQGRPALPAPASGVAPARPSIWVPDFKSGRLIPKE